jgi:hypothetical protein
MRRLPRAIPLTSQTSRRLIQNDLLALKLDVRERGQIAEAVEQTEARFGAIG